jgi:glycosyltransferase involved in cell wall biosynthesis
MRLLVDGVFFQLADTGIARVWRSILPGLVAEGFEIFLLDRGGAPQIEGVTLLPFPRYRPDQAMAADSELIQKVCDQIGADVFTTTYYTTPLATPMAMLVYDMIPELFGFDINQTIWIEKEVCISYAQRFLCISQSTRRDLLSFFPEIPSDRVEVAWCGVDRALFRPRDAAEVAAFRARHGLGRPYFLFVGSRVQEKSYKNSELFFRALPLMQAVDFDVFCVGGEPEIEPHVLDALPPGVRAQRVSLGDDDLAIAYAGAAALVYPSLYEGFGMPVIEAMASGCPVITTRHGSLAEAAGNAALLIGGDSAEEMAAALDRVRDPTVAADLRARGLAHSARFDWDAMTRLLARQLRRARDEAAAGGCDAFFAEWARLRRIQADVDLRI